MYLLTWSDDINRTQDEALAPHVTPVSVLIRPPAVGPDAGPQNPRDAHPALLRPVETSLNTRDTTDSV